MKPFAMTGPNETEENGNELRVSTCSEERVLVIDAANLNLFAFGVFGSNTSKAFSEILLGLGANLSFDTVKPPLHYRILQYPNRRRSDGYEPYPLG